MSSDNKNSQPASPRLEIGEAFIKSMSRGKSPFLRPTGAGAGHPPVNPASGITYSSINRIILTNAEQPDPRWMTEKQAEENGYQVKEGAAPQRLVRWDLQNDKVSVMRFYGVYNARDLLTLDGHDLPFFEPESVKKSPYERIEAMLANSGVKLETSVDRTSSYDSGRDVITLPSIDVIGPPDSYALAVRELVNRAVAQERLNQQSGSRFPAKAAAPEQESREKLKNHLAAFMVAQDLGLKFTPELEQLTIKHWRDNIKKEPDFLFQAATQAEKLRENIFSLEQNRDREQPDKPKAQAGHREKPARSSASKPNLSPEDELAQVLKKAGFKLDGSPVMDGSLQKVSVEGGKTNGKEGTYTARMSEGRPNGWFKNHLSGEYQTWAYSGQTLSEEKKGDLRREQDEDRRAAREQAEKKAYARWMDGVDVEQEFANQIDGLVPTSELLKNAYLEVAGIDPIGVRRDADGNLMAPGVNAEGYLKTICNISPTGQVLFEKGCRRMGAMCLIDRENEISEPGAKHGLPKLKEAEPGQEPSILIAEDYATGASLHMATDCPVAVVMAPDNFISVAKTLREKFPEANLVVCSPDPRPEYTKSHHFALEAAQESGAHLVKPVFQKTEQEAGLVTFNDMHKCFGLEAVAKSLAPALEKKAEQQNEQGPER